MKRSVIFLFVIIAGASVAFGDELPGTLESDLELLGALHQIRGMWVDPDVGRWEIERWIDDQIDLWRGPRADGSYEWIVRERPDTEIVDRSEHLVYGSREQLARIEGGDNWVYGVKIVVPRKRSLFRGNHPVWIEEIEIRTYSEEGRVGPDTISVQRWFAPDTSQTWEFMTLAPRASVAVEVGAEPDHKGESLVEIHFLQSVERDDPTGPHFESIQELRELDERLNAERIDRAIERTFARVIPDARSVPVAELVELLVQALEALDSDDPEEQEEVRPALVEALRLIRERR